MILSIFILFSIASVSAGEVDDKVMMSDENPEIESTPIEKDLKTTENNQVLSKANYDEIQSVKDSEITGADVDPDTNATFDDLKKEIGEGGNITLKHKFYNYNGTGQELEFISLKVPNSVINGNGAVINMNGSDTQVFHIESNNITVKNLTIKNACRDTTGLAFYVNGNDAKILDCNFIDNNGQLKGLIYFEDNINGAVTNCTFINNIADTYSWGGAIYNTNGNVAVTNCYFSGNYAGEGSDIYSESNSVTADTCIFKDTGTTYNVQIVPPALNVDDFVALNNSGEKLTFDLKTNSSMSVDNGNISISVYDKNNDSLIGEYCCLSGEGWTVNLPVGSYYAIFNTEYAGFKAINRTITVIPNTEYYINVTPMTTNNKIVNLTAKSNIPTDIIGGKLVFILPNGDEINGTYDSKDTWWTMHTFEEYKTYEINATYTNFKRATVNSATITVEKANSTIYLEDIVLDYPESKLVAVPTEGATGITAKIDGKNVSVVDNFTIQISDLDAGNYTLEVTTIPDETHLPVTKTANITVNKASVKIFANDLELNLDDKSKVNYALEPENATGRIYFESNNPEVVSVTSDGNITALSAGTANVTITFTGNKNYEKTNKTIKIKVNKINSTISIDDQVLDYGKSLNVTVDTTGTTGITAKINDKDAKVDGYTIEIPILDADNYTLTVTTVPDNNHLAVTGNATITVKKVDSTLNIGNIVFNYKGSGSTIAAFTGATGIKAEVVNQSKAVVNVDGSKITVSNLNAGTYTLKVATIADDNHNPVTKTAKITVNKLKTALNAKAITAIYNVNKNLEITLKDNAGNALRGVKITVNLKGTKTYTTDKNGKIKVSTKGLVPKGYTAKITFNGNTNYAKSTKSVKVTIKKATPKLTAKYRTFKKSIKTKKYSVILKTNRNKAMNKVKLIIKINKRTYSAITNNKGIATFKITKLAKTGKYTALVKFAGNKYYNTKSVKVKIAVK